MVRSAACGVMHVGMVFGVSSAFTGDVAIAGAIILVEPIVNAAV
jgi:uncharacterized membrane protein